MNITEFAVKNKVVTWLAVFLLIVAGVFSYGELGKLEDPEFTIKTAIISTQYSGASPVQVEKEVSEPIEIALQEIPEIDYIESLSQHGMSVVKVSIKSEYWTNKLPQIWDTLRRKIRNIEGSLPKGAARPDIGDDFSNVYGFVLAVTGDGFTYKQLEDETKKLKRKLSLVEDVSRVEFWGKQPRAVYLKVSESRLAEMGITANDIANTLNLQNAITASGSVYYDKSSARIEVTGGFAKFEDIAELTLRGRGISDGDNRALIKIKDIASVEEGFIEPITETMRYNGQPSIGLSISNVAGSNIIKLGKNLEKCLQELQEEIPVGIEIHRVAWQADEVIKSINNFMISLMEAIVIVLIVLTLFMGWRMGVVISTALLLTILGTFVFMFLFSIDLQSMSLGALVIALGMMVDNAIVVGDGVLLRLRRGMDSTQAAVESACGPSMPLLGATIIAVLAFYPVGGSTESVGEYCLSLFQVVGISLLFSWVISMTVTPLQCIAMLKVDGNDKDYDPYSSRFYRVYRLVLEKAINFKIVTLAIMLGLLIFSMWGFQFVSQMFFPDSSRAQFMIDMYAPNGTRVPYTSELMIKAENHIIGIEGVKSVSTFIGSGPPRFYLPVEPEMFNSSYGQLIVSVDDFREISKISGELRIWFKENFPEVPVFRVRKYTVGPGNTWKFEVRILAPADAELSEIRRIGEEGVSLLQDHPWVVDARIDWRERVPKIVVDYDQSRGRWANVTRNDVANATQRVFDGRAIGQFREDDDLLPILLRNNDAERENPVFLYTVQVPQSASMQSVPLTQVVKSVSLEWEDPLIWRRNRHRMIKIQAEPIEGVTLPSLRSDVLNGFDSFEKNLPQGYSMEWGAEAESSADAQKSLIPGMVPAAVLMFFIIVLLFNAMRPAYIIFLTIPLSVIGITAGLFWVGVPFGFMALLGGLSLTGMMIKNAIVLLDEIKLNITEKHQIEYDAVINACLSRLRPVALASATTVLGVIPLIQNVFWTSMAVTIMAGLTFGTILTMVVIPVLYSVFYRVK